MKMLLFLTIFLIVFTGCSNDDNTNIITGQVVDGYIKNATVCLDTNKNNLCDANEPSTLTDANGEFSIVLNEDYNGNYKLISIGGIDTSTDKEVNTTLQRVIFINNDTIKDLYVTPISTLVSNLYDSNDTNISEIENSVAISLGVDPKEIYDNPLQNKDIFNKTLQITSLVNLFEPYSNTNKIYNSLANIVKNNQELNATTIAQELDVEVDNKYLTFSNDLIKKIDEQNIGDSFTDYEKSYYNNINQVINIAKTDELNSSDLDKYLVVTIPTSSDNDTDIQDENQKTDTNIDDNQQPNSNASDTNQNGTISDQTDSNISNNNQQIDSNDSQQIVDNNTSDTNQNGTISDQTDSNVSNSDEGIAYLGNIAEATVNIYELNPLNGRKLLWTETTSKGNTLNEIGKFNAHINSLEDNTYYLYEIIGGEDWDSDDDGVIDKNFTKNKGSFIAIIKGSVAKELDNFTVTYLSNYFSQYIQHFLDSSDYTDIANTLLKDIFNINLTDTDKLMELLYQYIPSQDLTKLNSTYRALAPLMIDAIKNNHALNINSIIKLNGISIENQEIGLNGEVIADLNITSQIALGQIDVKVGIEYDNNKSFNTAYIPAIKKGTYIYPITIDLSTYHNITDGNLTTINIQGLTNLTFQINGTDVIKYNSVNFEKNTIVKFLEISFQQDLSLIPDTEKEILEVLDSNGTSTSIPIDPNPSLFELSQNGEDIEFSPTIEIINYLKDKNITGLKLESSLNVNNTEYNLPVINFDNSIDLNTTIKEALNVDFKLVNADKVQIIKDILSNILSSINETVDLDLDNFDLPLSARSLSLSVSDITTTSDVGSDITTTSDVSSDIDDANLDINTTDTVNLVETFEELVNQKLNDIMPIVNDGSTVKASINFVLKDKDGNELDRYQYPIELKIDSDIFEGFVTNLPSLLDGESLTIDELLNNIGG